MPRPNSTEFPLDDAALKQRLEQDEHGRIYMSGEASGRNSASKRSLTQANRKCSKWLKPSSLHRIPTPLKRCSRSVSHLQALSTMPLPNSKPNSLNFS